MLLTAKEKEALKRELAESLAGEPEIRKIAVFGSFVRDGDDNGLDVAIFHDSTEGYLPWPSSIAARPETSLSVFRWM